MDPKNMEKQAQTAAAAATTPEVEKPLPAMASPTVNLPVELREAIALRCRDTGESFAVKTSKMWFELLKAEKRVDQKLEIDFSVKRGGGGAGKAKEELAVALKQIADLQAKLAEALKAKNGK